MFPEVENLNGVVEKEAIKSSNLSETPKESSLHWIFREK